MPIGTGMDGDIEVGTTIGVGTAGGALAAASSSDRQSSIGRRLRFSTPRHRRIITRHLRPTTAIRGITEATNKILHCLLTTLLVCRANHKANRTSFQANPPLTATDFSFHLVGQTG